MSDDTPAVKRGRPPKLPGEKRRRWVKVYFTDDELDALYTAARRARTDLSVLIRESMISMVPKIQPV